MGAKAARKEISMIKYVGPEDRIYVAGDQAVRLFDSAGEPVSTIELEAAPSCR